MGHGWPLKVIEFVLQLQRVPYNLGRNEILNGWVLGCPAGNRHDQKLYPITPRHLHEEEGERSRMMGPGLSRLGLYITEQHTM